MAWGFFTIYAVATAALALWAGRGTASAATFAIGSGQMPPWVVGITLGATLASSATFVLYPGFVYADGLGALVGFSVPLVAGLLLGLVLFAPRFQRIGAWASALTVPHWLGARYDDLGLRRLFAALQVLNVAYLVLIVVGCAYVMEASLGLPYHVATVGITAFVFGYTALGGATAHAFTNTLQGLMMLVVAVTVFASGASLLPETWASLQSTGLTAPDSRLFSTPFEVLGVPFLIGIALTTQPHLLSKALYVRGSRALWTTVAIGIVTYATFALMLSAGAYARVVLPEGVAQDRVVAEYLQVAFAWPWVGAAISVAILAASMSTLDGLLVAIAASVGNDVLPGRGTVWVNRVVLAALALATLVIAWSPPKLVLILGQLGVYGLVAASVGPLLVGLFYEGRLARWPAWLGALVPLVVHFGLALTVVDNPGISALVGIAVGIPLSGLAAVVPASRSVPTSLESSWRA
ncbi:MAG: hypothetical protein KTR31_41345 [Myxococcales bacterium]|nr:hypothetical protein [Myxococcales bacterium]